MVGMRMSGLDVDEDLNLINVNKVAVCKTV